MSSISTPKTFKQGEEIVSGKQAIADGFRNFYQSVAFNLKKAAFPLSNFVWRHHKCSTPNFNQFNFNDVSDDDVLKFLRKLKRKSATGLDNIPSCFLKDVAFVISKPLTHVINLSLKTGEFPNNLKTARVTPIFKSGTKNSFDN